MRLKITAVRYPDRKNLVLRWTDPETGKPKTRTAGTTRRREAERAAARLESELLERTAQPDAAITWRAFRRAYGRDHLAGRSVAAQAAAATVLDRVERFSKPRYLVDLTAAKIAAWQTKLRAIGLAPSTVAGHTARLKAALNWGHEMGMLPEVPAIRTPKTAADKMRGRPITGEEFDRMLAKTAAVVPIGDAPSWRRFLHGLWLSGLRIGEAVRLSWDPDAAVSIDLDNGAPAFRFRTGGQKSGRCELCPMAPDFADWLERIPEHERSGLVFPLGCQVDHASKTVCAIGSAAGVVVERGTRLGKPHVKYASAHDLRRAFGLRWSKLVMPPTLMQLMRHRDVKTTLKYYVGRNLEDAAEQLRSAFDAQDRTDRVTPRETSHA